MKNFYLPNYKDGSIVNLMGSIAGKFGVGSLYKQLKSLPAEKLRDSKNIVLLIIDGLGYNYLRKRKNSFLFKNLRGSMTSVFLPTTAAAITSFLTGVAPQQHAYTAWFMHLKEVGAVSEILFFSPRFGGMYLVKIK